MLFRLDPSGQDRADLFMERPEVIQPHRFELNLLRQHSDVPHVRFLSSHIAIPQNNQWGLNCFQRNIDLTQRPLNSGALNNPNNYTPAEQKITDGGWIPLSYIAEGGQCAIEPCAVRGSSGIAEGLRNATVDE